MDRCGQARLEGRAESLTQGYRMGYQCKWPVAYCQRYPVAGWHMWECPANCAKAQGPVLRGGSLGKALSSLQVSRYAPDMHPSRVDIGFPAGRPFPIVRDALLEWQLQELLGVQPGTKDAVLGAVEQMQPTGLLEQV